MKTQELMTIAAAAERFHVTTERLKKFVADRGIAIVIDGIYACVNVADPAFQELVKELNDSDPVCKACGQEYHLRTNCEPTDYCDDCAQSLVVELREACIELRAAFQDGCGEATSGPKRRRLVAAGDAMDKAIAKAKGRKP